MAVKRPPTPPYAPVHEQEALGFSQEGAMTRAGQGGSALQVSQLTTDSQDDTGKVTALVSEKKIK